MRNLLAICMCVTVFATASVRTETDWPPGILHPYYRNEVTPNRFRHRPIQRPDNYGSSRPQPSLVSPTEAGKTPRSGLQRGSGLYPGTGVNATSGNRRSRFLSLFSVVRFENLECGAVSGDNGTCVAGSECLERGGVASGPCAGGFGVCCVFIVTCGQTTFHNNTYFVNSGYPGPYDGTGSCQLTIHKRHPGICQIRLDFDQFMVTGPELVHHVCNNDQFIVSGGSPVPAICGTNTGNHMYVDAGAGYTSPVTLTFVTSGPSFPRNWKVRVSQIPCNSNFKAEDGCLQYHTGVTGQLRSFNYDSGSGLQLSNQDYSMCIRMERNFCGIQYTAAPDAVNNRSRSFSLSGQTTGQQQVTSMVGSVGPNSCNGDWIIIPCAANAGRAPSLEPTCTDRLCGGTFNSEVSTIPSTVYSTVKPFRVIFHTNNQEYPNDQNNRGFALNYVQQPCTNILH